MRALWREFQKTLLPFTFTIQKDEVVTSDTDPRQKLRRIEVKFYSQEIDGRKWGHPSVIFMPADPHVYQTPERRGKVVAVGQRSIDGLATGSWRSAFPGNYGEPIAARTGYPTMVVPVPGEYDDKPAYEISIGFLNGRAAKSGQAIDHNYFRLAVPYLRALDVFAAVLGERNVRAVVGGHSKRATSAYTAAAMDPGRIAGVVYTGNESTFSNMESKKHFLDWQMWVAHVFEGRPLTHISDFTYEETAEGTLFRARIESPNRIITCRTGATWCGIPSSCRRRTATSGRATSPASCRMPGWSR